MDRPSSETCEFLQAHFANFGTPKAMELYYEEKNLALLLRPIKSARKIRIGRKNNEHREFNISIQRDTGKFSS